MAKPCLNGLFCIGFLLVYDFNLSVQSKFLDIPNETLPFCFPCIPLLWIVDTPKLITREAKKCKAKCNTLPPHAAIAGPGCPAPPATAVPWRSTGSWARRTPAPSTHSHPPLGSRIALRRPVSSEVLAQHPVPPRQPVKRLQRGSVPGREVES